MEITTRWLHGGSLPFLTVAVLKQEHETTLMRITQAIRLNSGPGDALLDLGEKRELTTRGDHEHTQLEQLNSPCRGDQVWGLSFQNLASPSPVLWFLARTSPLWLLIAPRWSYERPRVEAMKGVKATEQENYVENKGSYSCFKTFSQLGLGVFNQLSFFFFLLQVLLSAKHLQRERENKEKREKQF